jgi:hypothetical protein
MNCRECRNRFSAYMDGDLDNSELRSFEGHLAECARCAAELAQVEKVVSLTVNLPHIQPSPDFDRALRAKLTDLGTQGIDAGVRFQELFGRRVVTAFGVIFLILGTTLGVYLYNVRHRDCRGEDERIQISAGREIVPMVHGRASENIPTNFVMPSMSALKSGGPSPSEVPSRALRRSRQDRNGGVDIAVCESRTFVLPFVTGQQTAKDAPDANYVIKRVSLTGAPGETGL